MHHQHPLARQCRAPRLGVVVGFQRTQFGKAGGIAAADDLPLGPHVPQGQQLRILGTFNVETTEFFQRRIIRGEHARQIADILPRAVGIIFAAVLQIVGHGAHFGRATAAKQKRLAAFQQFPRQVVAGPGG